MSRGVLALSPEADDGAVCVMGALKGVPEVDVVCGTCARRICVGTRATVRLPRGLDPPATRLGTGDYCRWCVRPISEGAKARAPVEGYIAFARRAGRRAAVGT